MTREDIALEAEHLDLLDALAAAKASGDRDELAAAKSNIRAFRQQWREIRAAFGTPSDGEATPAPLDVQVKES